MEEQKIEKSTTSKASENTASLIPPPRLIRPLSRDFRSEALLSPLRIRGSRRAAARASRASRRLSNPPFNPTPPTFSAGGAASPALQAAASTQEFDAVRPTAIEARQPSRRGSLRIRAARPFDPHRSRRAFVAPPEPSVEEPLRPAAKSPPTSSPHGEGQTVRRAVVAGPRDRAGGVSVQPAHHRPLRARRTRAPRRPPFAREHGHPRAGSRAAIRNGQDPHSAHQRICRRNDRGRATLDARAHAHGPLGHDFCHARHAGLDRRSARSSGTPRGRLQLRFGHPAEELPITADDHLPGHVRHAVVDIVTASAALKTMVVAAESSPEYQTLLEALQRELKYKAFRKGATGIVSFAVHLTQLHLPMHYRVMVTGSAVKPGSQR